MKPTDLDSKLLVSALAGHELVRTARDKLARLRDRTEGDGMPPSEDFLALLDRSTAALNEASRLLVLQVIIVETSMKAGIDATSDLEALAEASERARSDVRSLCDLLDAELDGIVPEGGN